MYNTNDDNKRITGGKKERRKRARERRRTEREIPSIKGNPL